MTAPGITLCALTLAGLAATAAAASDVTLRIGGNAAARFTLDCGDFADSGAPPFERRVEGPLNCTVTQTASGGKLRVEVVSESGNVSVMATGGAGSTLRFHVE